MLGACEGYHVKGLCLAPADNLVTRLLLNREPVEATTPLFDMEVAHSEDCRSSFGVLGCEGRNRWRD